MLAFDARDIIRASTIIGGSEIVRASKRPVAPLRDYSSSPLPRNLAERSQPEGSIGHASARNGEALRTGKIDFIMMKGIRSCQSFQAPMVLNCRAKAMVDRNRRVNEQPPFFKRITVIREVTGPS
jgi:hypothetical protein